MRNKRGERERQAERVGEHTGGAARPGKQLVGIGIASHLHDLFLFCVDVVRCCPLCTAVCRLFVSVTHC